METKEMKLMADKLGDMPVEEFRQYGHQLVDWVADFLTRINDIPAFPDVQPGDIRRKLPAVPPAKGEAMEDILADIDRVVMPGMVHWNHPSCFAYFNSSGSGPGILGDLLSAAFNVNSMLWHSCPAATELEEVTLDWLRQMVRLPAEFWGVITDGGSSSTMYAIAAAREQLADWRIRELGLAGRPELPCLRIYTSEYGHSSIDKAALALGLGLESVRRVAVDDTYRMQPQALAEAIREDRSAGILPFCVVATAGTTSCTSIDPIAEVAAICEREQLWLHVDGAHGGAAAILPELNSLFDGWERADSIVINPHKWMFVPLDLSVLYTRKREVLRSTFSLTPEYLRTAQGDEVTNYMDYGIPLGRRFRALKLWFVLRYFGVEGLANRIRKHIALAQRFAEEVDAHWDFERLAPVPLSTVCFRAHPAEIDDDESLNTLNEKLLEAINHSGQAFLSHTKLSGRYVLRLVISHLRTEEMHVNQVWQLAQQALRTVHQRTNQ
jgi:aromatic-L-amino-acid decarboxylase